MTDVITGDGRATVTMARKTAWYGWTPDLPDIRDHLYAAPGPLVRTLPPSIDLRPGCPAVYDQGQLGSCTANAIAGALQFDQKKQAEADSVPSRLFIYYSERELEGTIATDSGAQLRDGVKCVNKFGAPPESDWPYDIAKFTERPPDAAYKDALQHEALEYQRIGHSLVLMKGCLAEGFPFVFGFTVYESFESQEVAKTGHAPLPQPGERVLGGHAVLAVGYDDSSQTFLARNSWGDSWGMAGYFTLPYPYLTERGLSSDFWTIRRVT